MARKVETIQTIIDDYTGKEIKNPGPTTHLVLENKVYNLDLSEDSLEKLREAIAPFVKNATPVSRSGKRSPSRSSSSTSDGLAADIVRAWAKENGIKVNERGRLSKDLVAQYRAAN